jgi:hypothetical protein
MLEQRVRARKVKSNHSISINHIGNMHAACRSGAITATRLVQAYLRRISGLRPSRAEAECGDLSESEGALGLQVLQQGLQQGLQETLQRRGVASNIVGSKRTAKHRNVPYILLTPEWLMAYGHFANLSFGRVDQWRGSTSTNRSRRFHHPR